MKKSHLARIFFFCVIEAEPIENYEHRAIFPLSYVHKDMHKNKGI